RLLLADGTHYTPAGYGLLADAVADCILRQLSVLQSPPHVEQAPGPEGAATYRKQEAERDAQVPPAYRSLKVGTFEPPRSGDDWRRERPEVLRKVRGSLGDLPPRPSPAKARVVSREVRRGYTLERVAIENGVDGEVAALILVPTARQGPAP